MPEKMTTDREIAKALCRVFESPAVANSPSAPANLVDVVYDLAESVNEGLMNIASAISDLAAAIRETRSPAD
jgi:hypothetical protein